MGLVYHRQVGVNTLTGGACEAILSLPAASGEPVLEADVPAQQEGSRVAAALRREAGVESSPPPKGFFDHEYPDAVAATMSATRKFDLASVVDKLTMPVLIGTGSHDPNLVSSRVIAATAPNARLAVLENVGHNSMLEHPALALQTFLECHDGLGT